MTPHLRLLEAQQESLYRQFCQNTRHRHTLDLERLITVDGVQYLCGFEVSIEWHDDFYPLTRIECISEVEATNEACQEHFSTELRAKIDRAVRAYCEDRIEELEELAKRKARG